MLKIEIASFAASVMLKLDSARSWVFWLQLLISTHCVIMHFVVQAVLGGSVCGACSSVQTCK